MTEEPQEKYAHENEVKDDRKSDEDTDQEGIDSQEMARQEQPGNGSSNRAASTSSLRSPRTSLRNKAHVLTERTVNTAHMLKDQTIDTYQHASWCALPRWIAKFPRDWPRVTSFFFGIVVPLWILIGLAAGFGFLLAGFENGQEIES
jgi:hypothetical protein